MRPVSIVPLMIALALPAAVGPPPAGVIAVDPVRSPFCLVTESVRVSVGKDLSIVEGDYDFKYVRRFEPGQTPDRIAFQYPVFAPKEVDNLETLIAITQPRLRVGSLEFAPEDFTVLAEPASGSLQFVSEDVRVFIFTFLIPRALLRQQCRLHISHYQPHYRFAGKEVSACLPLLPDFESLKDELLFSRIDFIVEFEAVDAVRLRRLSANESVAQESPQRVKVHPVHRENIAVEVTRPAPA
jgi:hypothetical protein